MFNTKLKKQVEELESRIEFQTRWNNEIYRLLERVCIRLDALETLESER